MWLEAILYILLAYCIGSFPSAYLLVKWRYKRKLTKEGSGNIGTFNVLRTTKSKSLSVSVLILDFLKGFLAVFLGKNILMVDPLIYGLMAIFVVIGHNYTIWLGFKGGRGLATSAGVVLLLAPTILLIWLIIWAVFYLLSRQIIYSSVFATVLIHSFLWWPSEKYVAVKTAIVISIITVFIIIKHIPRLKDVWLKRSVESSA